MNFGQFGLVDPYLALLGPPLASMAMPWRGHVGGPWGWPWPWSWLRSRAENIALFVRIGTLDQFLNIELLMNLAMRNCEQHAIQWQLVSLAAKFRDLPWNTSVFQAW